MAKPISKFFEDLGFPLRNVRWSWGARTGDTILLRTWEDQLSFKDWEVIVFKSSWSSGHDSFGLDERINHLKSIWNGEVSAYTVMAEVKDRTTSPREIKDYRDDIVYWIESLRQRDDGSIVAKLGSTILVNELSNHALSHKAARVEGAFPVDDSLITGASTDTYKDKIPPMRAWLIEVCERRSTVTYSEVMDRFGLTFFPLRNAMSRLGHQSKDAGEPIITAVIVDKDTHRCSEGFQNEFGVEDDQAERERCYAHWRREPRIEKAQPSGKAGAPSKQTLEELVRRFNQVEVRPHQSKFRTAVFTACGGKCVVSGCDVPEALDAAHLVGRNWREGHNEASDGILLRRDLHALYDSGLLTIKTDGMVSVAAAAGGYYGEFNGRLIQGLSS